MYGSVVVIDDDDDILGGITDYLKLVGFDVVGIGHNGLEAVQLYEEYRPDMVLTDISMPNYDGFYGIENIKRLDPDAKIIILTGNCDEFCKQKIESFNISKVLEKPCSLSKIEQVLKSVYNVTKLPSTD